MFSRIAILAYGLLLIACVASAAHIEEKRGIVDPITSLFSQATQGAESIFSDATSLGASVASDVTSFGGSIATIVTSVGGEAATIITSEGGKAITLATNGVVTSFAGSVYTAATGAVLPTSSNAAPASFPSVMPLFTSLTAVLGSIFLGAYIVL